MEYNLPSEIVKDLNFGDQAKEKIIKGVDFKNINDIEHDRSQLSYTPSSNDLLYTQNKMLNDKKEEEDRRRRLQNNDEIHFLQYIHPSITILLDQSI